MELSQKLMYGQLYYVIYTEKKEKKGKNGCYVCYIKKYHNTNTKGHTKMPALVIVTFPRIIHVLSAILGEINIYLK